MNTMRRSLLLLSIIFSITATAQSWCPPGATWTHGIMAFYIEGYLQTTYTGDTILGGSIGQKLSMTSVEFNHLTDTVITTYSPVGAITSHGEGIVSIWSHSLQTWDTLYWMAAVPGQKWRVAHSDDECEPADHILVADTGTTVVDGVSLRYLDLVAVYDMNEYPLGRSIERLGWMHWMMLFPGCFAVEGPGGLRCYSDDEINYTSPTWNYGCNSLADLTEHRNSSNIIIHPNPGTDHFILSGVEGQLPPGEHELKILDQLGRSVIEMDRISDQDVIGTASLPPGIYTVLITHRNGRSLHQHWVKQ